MHYKSKKATWWMGAGCFNMRRKTLPGIHPGGGRKRIRIPEQPKEETSCVPGHLGLPVSITASSGSATSNTNWAAVPHTLGNI